ncbi:hypothetical protein A9K70_07405 [Stenotrophomonas maltophilia]|nr:hypothetical protein A9K70_07405 [Stenotrophomonas maltophilia]
MSFAPRKDGASRLDLLPRQVYWIAQNTPAALWPTPCARDHMPAHSPEYIAEKKAQGHGMAVLPDYVQHAPPGTGPDGSSDTTERPGALNPAFVCWLMGFLAEWDACAPTAMPSSRKSRRK